MNDADLNELYDNRSDPDVRMVLEDLALTRGEKVTRLGSALWVADADADADADAVADAGAVAVAVADAGAVAVAVAGAVADAGAGAGAVAGAVAVAVAGAGAGAGAVAGAVAVAVNQMMYGDLDMRNGLKIIQLSSPRYGYAITLIGWLRRVSGDELILCAGARMLSCSSGQRLLTQVAVEGPKRDHKCWPPSEGPEEVHRLLIRRALPADEKAWAEHCPRPKDWSE